MSKAPQTARILRVFVSSPGDVTEERGAMDDVVASINRTDGHHGFRLELFKWKVCQFRENLQSQGIVCGYTGVRGNNDSFYDKVAEHLRKIVHRLIPPSPGDTPPPPPANTGKYLRNLEETTSYIDIRGLTVESGKAPRFPIDELYIPLTTTLHESLDKGGAKRKDRSAEMEARGSTRTELEVALKKRRLAIVGDPGSGKTTFLRRIAYLLCQTQLGTQPRAAAERLGLKDAPFPIFIGLADLTDHIAASRKRGDGPDEKVL